MISGDAITDLTLTQPSGFPAQGVDPRTKADPNFGLKITEIKQKVVVASCIAISDYL